MHPHTISHRGEPPALSRERDVLDVSSGLRSLPFRLDHVDDESEEEDPDMAELDLAPPRTGRRLFADFEAEADAEEILGWTDVDGTNHVLTKAQLRSVVLPHLMIRESQRAWMATLPTLTSTDGTLFERTAGSGGVLRCMHVLSETHAGRTYSGVFSLESRDIACIAQVMPCSDEGSLTHALSVFFVHAIVAHVCRTDGVIRGHQASNRMAKVPRIMGLFRSERYLVLLTYTDENTQRLSDHDYRQPALVYTAVHSFVGYQIASLMSALEPIVAWTHNHLGVEHIDLCYTEPDNTSLCGVRRFQTLVRGFEWSRLVYKGIPICASPHPDMDRAFRPALDISWLAASTRASFGIVDPEGVQECPYILRILDEFYRVAIALGYQGSPDVTYRAWKREMTRIIQSIAPLCAGRPRPGSAPGEVFYV